MSRSLPPPADAPRHTRLAPAALLSAFLLVACTGGSEEPPPGATPDAALAVDAADAPSDAISIDVGTADALANSADAPLATACEDPPPLAVVDVTVADLNARMTAGDPLAVVDVREPNETAAGIIEGALLYPWTSGVLTADHAMLPDDVPLFVICRSGSRSAAASQFLVDNGHACIHNVLGGMNAWTEAGYPTVAP